MTTPNPIRVELNEEWVNARWELRVVKLDRNADPLPISVDTFVRFRTREDYLLYTAGDLSVAIPQYKLTFDDGTTKFV